MRFLAGLPAGCPGLPPRRAGLPRGWGSVHLWALPAGVCALGPGLRAAGGGRPFLEGCSSSAGLWKGKDGGLGRPVPVHQRGLGAVALEDLGCGRRAQRPLGSEIPVSTKRAYPPPTAQDGPGCARGIIGTCVPEQIPSETHHLPGGENVDGLRITGATGRETSVHRQAWDGSLLPGTWGDSTPPGAGLGPHPPWPVWRGLWSPAVRARRGRWSVVAGDPLSLQALHSATTARAQVTVSGPLTHSPRSGGPSKRFLIFWDKSCY